MGQSYIATRNSMLQTYPRLFLDEADVLHHLFFVSGNGFSWKAGVLTDGLLCSARSTEARRSRRLFVNSFFNSKFKSAVLESIQHLDIETERSQERLRRLQLLKQETTEYFLHSNGCIGLVIHPLSEYAKILNVPTDVKSDWLAAARTALSVARAQFRRTVSDDKWLTRAEAYLKHFEVEKQHVRL